MHERFEFRPALMADYAFCERLYFEGMRGIIEALTLDEARQRENLEAQWRLREVRIIAVAGGDVGWLQVEPMEDALFLKQLYVVERSSDEGSAVTS